MSRVILAAVLLTLAGSPLVASAQPPPTTLVILVDDLRDPADDWTAARATAALAAVDEALGWWAARLPDAPPPPRRPEVSTRQVEPALLGDPRRWLPPPTRDLVIYVVSTPPGSPLQLFDGHSGYGPARQAVALERPILGPLAALLAHEIGHAWYGLTHPADDADQLDIMGTAYRLAYAAPTVGCESLAQLGRPCARVALPLLAGPQPGFTAP